MEKEKNGETGVNSGNSWGGNSEDWEKEGETVEEESGGTFQGKERVLTRNFPSDPEDDTSETSRRGLLELIGAPKEVETTERT